MIYKFFVKKFMGNPINGFAQKENRKWCLPNIFYGEENKSWSKM